MSAGLILLYHRVFDLDHDPEQLAVHPSRFEAHVQYLHRNFNVLPLREIVRRISSRESLEDVAAITFDDGYADNLHVAGPILKKYYAPATFFVAAGLIDGGREFWWDELERIIFARENMGRRLEIELDGLTHQWEIGSGPTIEIYKNVHKLIRQKPHVQRAAVLDGMLAWSAPGGRPARPTHRVMNALEVAELAGYDLFEIGSHGMTHSSLIAESEERLQHEIFESKRILERLVGIEVRSISYPFGLKNDINGDILQATHEAGYTCGLANIRGLVRHDTDLFMIPRFLVRNWRQTEFRQAIEEFRIMFK